MPQFTLPETRPPHKGPWASQPDPAVNESDHVPAPRLAAIKADSAKAPVAGGESTKPAAVCAPVSPASPYPYPSPPPPAPPLPPPLPAAAADVALNPVVTPAPPSRASGERLRRPAWAAWARGAESESYDVVRATPRQLEMVYWLACLLPFAAVFTAAPAVPHVQFAGAPFWAQLLLGSACLQFVYAAWLATVPDFSGVHVGVCLLAGITTIEFLAAVGLPFLPDAFLSFAGLVGARAAASAWCGLAAVVNGLSCASCRWLERRWRAGKI